MTVSFLYTLGFIALVGIPLIILIYIIKNRYTEQIISSTYLWTLSEKFLKRKVPISKLADIISLILQILIVVCIAFALVQPTLIVLNGAESYCFVIDGSGSMNTVQDGQTRFDIAKDKIIEMIAESKAGSDYTLIYTGTQTNFEFSELGDRETAIQRVSGLSVDYTAMETDDALAAAQEYFDYKNSRDGGNIAVSTYLFTDKDYDEHDNIKIVNVAKSVENYAVTGVTFSFIGSQLRIAGTATSYKSQKEVTLELRFDGAERVFDSKKVNATPEGAEFEFICSVSSFGFFSVSIAEEDALALDNEVVMYDVTSQNISDILLVSDSPFFMRAALVSAGVTKIDFITVDEYEGQTGYGLYIFDSIMPEVMPDDGTVWFINPKSTLKEANFSFQSEVDREVTARYTLPNTTAQTLLSGICDSSNKMNIKTFSLKNYVKCGFNEKFFTTLATCENNPVLVVGSNSYGNREVVFAFDLHDSAEFALMGDLATLVKNLINYSFPTAIDKTAYFCGDTIQVNMINGCRDVQIRKPDGVKKPAILGSAVAEYTFTDVGVHEIILIMKDNSERKFYVYAELQEEERNPDSKGESFSVTGKAGNNKPDQPIEILLYIFIAIAVLAVADYGIYCYEQYQLR